MYPYLPHTEQDIRDMLDAVGEQTLEDLFRDISPELRLPEGLNLKDGKSEGEVFSLLKVLSEKNRVFEETYAGCGIYDHISPRVVSHLAGRSEFYTSYTPYQAEISQGILQGIFEYQSMISLITGLPVSNASLYDGHTACSEACIMALNSNRKNKRILISSALHPHTCEVLRTHFSHLDAELVFIRTLNGLTDSKHMEEELSKGAAGVLMQSPNIYGCLENLDGLAEKVHEQKALLILSSNPLSLGILKSPAGWGADMAVGDTQPFGLKANFGGPTVGYLAATEKLLRKMPGRIVGETLDKEGKRAFVLTLQAREQHIKRHSATSNICSNQALAALISTIHLAAVGRDGYREIAERNVQASHYLHQALTDLDGIESLNGNPFFNEFTLKLPCSAEKVLRFFENNNVLAGISVSSLFSESKYENLLIIAVTEKRSRLQLDHYVSLMKEVLS